MYKVFESQRQGCEYMKRDSRVNKSLNQPLKVVLILGSLNSGILLYIVSASKCLCLLCGMSRASKSLCHLHGTLRAESSLFCRKITMPFSVSGGNTMAASLRS